MISEESYLKTIKDFLFSNMNRQFFIFLFFLILSAVFWLIMTLNETYEKEMKIPVSIVNVPKNVMLTSSATDTVRITVRDKGWVLMSYLYGDKHYALNVSFKSHDHNDGTGSVTATELKRIAEQELQSSSKIVSVKPERIEFYYNNGERKRVPVRWKGRVIPEQLYFISQVEYDPDSVDIYTSQEKLDSIRVISTEPLNYVGFRDTLRITCRLSHQADVKVVPDRINIGFYTDVLTEESIDGVPIQCINVPEGIVLRTFPTKVKVHFVAGVSQIRDLKPEDFTVIADYREIQQKPAEKCNLYLQHSPHGISRATLSIKQVDYLIEEE